MSYFVVQKSYLSHETVTIRFAIEFFHENGGLTFNQLKFEGFDIWSYSGPARGLIIVSVVRDHDHYLMTGLDRFYIYHDPLR